MGTRIRIDTVMRRPQSSRGGGAIQVPQLPLLLLLLQHTSVSTLSRTSSFETFSVEVNFNVFLGGHISEL